MPGDRGLIGELTRRGQEAATTLARRLGLPAGDPVVLSSRGNLLVRLAPAPVVARVATLTAWSRTDPYAWLAREVAVAAYVAARGGPVVAPSSCVDPGPHRQDGLVISLWQYVAPAKQVPSPAEVGSALAQLHGIARDCPAELGDLSPAREHISDGIATLARHALVGASALAALRDEHAGVLATLTGAGGPPVVLHGDAHAGNMLMGEDRSWLWLDLEETCRGPAEWDLTTMVMRYQEDAGAAATALRSYAAAAGAAVPDASDLAPFRRARDLEATVWLLCMAHLYPARYRDLSATRLAALLSQRC